MCVCECECVGLLADFQLVERTKHGKSRHKWDRSGWMEWASEWASERWSDKERETENPASELKSKDITLNHMHKTKRAREKNNI